MLEITDAASRVITKQLNKQQKPAGGLRIAVKSGGCSGFSYVFTFDATEATGDSVFGGLDGAKVFVDPRSLRLLDGTILDFDEGNLLAASFILKNPQAKSTCGCGTSFSAEL